MCSCASWNAALISGPDAVGCGATCPLGGCFGADSRRVVPLLCVGVDLDPSSGKGVATAE